MGGGGKGAGGNKGRNKGGEAYGGGGGYDRSSKGGGQDWNSRGGGHDNGSKGGGSKGGGKAADGYRGGGGSAAEDWKGGRSGGESTASNTALAASLEPGQPRTVPLYGAAETDATKPRSPTFEELPAWSAAAEVKAACQRSQVVVVQGETGCGKSSVLPMIFLDDEKAKIAVTQPRRIAAISLAQRVASQLKESVGQTVGYRVAMDGEVSAKTRLSFVTTGWLLMFLAHKPTELMKYTHIVLDEIHERDLDMDLLCLLLKRSLPNFPKLRLILMSATVDATQFLNYFSGPSVRTERDAIVVGSRRFPTYPYFLDDLVNNGALPGFQSRIRLDRFEKTSGRVDVNPQLFEACGNIVQLLAKPGLCVLIFLPGLSEIEQLFEVFTAQRGNCKLALHMLHSVVPHDKQRLALEPPPLGHCKVVLSTNIAESSVTIPDVRYILDFGIVRKMVFDEERAMQSLCNTWSSQATCRQRRGRCGRLQEGVIIYLFPRSHYARLQPYASPEVLGVPLESIYLKAKVLLKHLGRPENLLSELIDSPPQQRITAAAQNLRDLGALRGDEVSSLGRIAVFMPTTIQLTKLVVLSWSLGIPADGIVIAAALSTQDVFKLAAPANCQRLEDFPSHLSHNYITRARFDGGQFSEPIMYRNLFMDYLKVNKKSGQYHQWLDNSCVAVSRMSQFSALVTELAAKLGCAVPTAKYHAGIQRLVDLKRSQQLRPDEVDALFTQDYDRLKFAIVGAFQPSFVQGEINTQNKNKGKINGCGFDPMKTCLLQQIKPPEMADPDMLWEFCQSLAPISDVKLNDTGKVAFIECGDDSEVAVPPSDVVRQMPLLAQLLHQLMRQPCKFQALTDRRIWHDQNKIGSPNFLNGMKWHVNGMRTMGCPYWRSNMGYMCEMRGELKCHWGVCSSLLGREGPDQVRITGLTILPPPGTMTGTVMILAFLSGPFQVTFLGQQNGFKGVQVVATDCKDARPMVLSFSPGWWTPADTQLLNDFRQSVNELLTEPDQAKADDASKQYDQLVNAIKQKKKDHSKNRNDFMPEADYQYWNHGDSAVEATLVPPSVGSLELYQVGAAKINSGHRGPAKKAGDGYGTMEHDGPQAKFRAAPPWLRAMSAIARQDLEADLSFLCEKFGLFSAQLVEVYKHGLPSGSAVDIVGSAKAVEAAKVELVEGILQYYATQVEWSSSEMPAWEPAPEPNPKQSSAVSAERDLAKEATPREQRDDAPSHAGGKRRVWHGKNKDADANKNEEATGNAPDNSLEDGGGWGEAPIAQAADGGWGDFAAPVAADVDWGTAERGSPGAEDAAWGDDGTNESYSGATIPGLVEAMAASGMSAHIEAVQAWASEQGAITLEEITDNAELVASDLGLTSAECTRLAKLGVPQRGRAMKF